jgi:hypothetical protein
MNEPAFAENFVWYEWSFVSPDDFGPADGEDRGEDDRPQREARTRGADGWNVAA